MICVPICVRKSHRSVGQAVSQSVSLVEHLGGYSANKGVALPALLKTKGKVIPINSRL